MRIPSARAEGLGSRLLAAILSIAAVGSLTPAWGGVPPEAGPAEAALPRAGPVSSPALQLPEPARQGMKTPAPGGLRQALGALLLDEGEGAIPPEPRRETPPGSRRSFLRSRGGAVFMIVAGAILVGSVARNSIRDDT